LVEKYAEDVGMDEDETLALQESMGQLHQAVGEQGEADEDAPVGEEAASISGRLMRIAGPPIPTESGVIHKPLAVKKAEKDQDTEVVENEDTDPSNLRLLNVEGIVYTDGLSVYKDQAGRLWTGLATYWIKRGEFDRATATFEKGLATVLTIRDFTQIFDAYAEFSETMISTLMDALADEDNLEDEDFDAEDTEKDLDERMKAFEVLMDRRPFLVNEVLIRRNPHEVVEWEKRIALYGNNDEKVVETYIKALDTISPRKATGPLYPLYVNFAKFYEEGGSVNAETGESATEPNITEARKIFEKGSRVHFKTVDELAELWCEWAEMELRNE
jgi:pre-mRNA-splicing factor SYF1